MNKIIVALVMSLGFFAARTASALTYLDYTFHGSSCVFAPNGTSVPDVVYNSYGMSTSSTTVALAAFCPIVLPSHGYTYGYILVSGYNRSSTDQLFCTITSTGQDGNNSLQGKATLTQNQGSLQQAAVTINPNALYSIFSLQCHIPAQTGSGFSHLTSIELVVGY